MCHFLTGLVVDLGLMHGAGIEDVDAQGDGFGLAITIEDGGDVVLYVTELWIVADGLAGSSIMLRVGTVAVPDEDQGIVG